MKELFENEEVDLTRQSDGTDKQFTDAEINEKYTKGEVRIITEQARYPLNSILSMAESSEYQLNPEFQRRHRWPTAKKSRLIESFIMNVPIPPIFLYEAKLSEYEVMDGLQRLTAISQFYRDEYALEGLEEWPEINGMTYSKLPEKVRKGIDRRYLSSIILLQETAKTEEEANFLKQMVFERINSGGEKLKPQETRNALYPGAINSLCIKLARYPSFCKMWDLPEPSEDELQGGLPPEELTENYLYKTMEDVELVLRFFAYRQIEKWVSPSLGRFLDEYQQQANNFPLQVIQNLSDLFMASCDLLHRIFGIEALWLYRKRRGEWIHYERPTKVLYDPMMYVISDLLEGEQQLVSKQKEIREALPKVHKDNYELLGGRSNNRSDVQKRIEFFQEFFGGFLS